MTKDQKFAQNLISFIEKSPTCFHATKNVEKVLIEAGFKRLEPEDSWELKRGGKYYTLKNNSAIIGFIVGEGELEKDGFRLVASHLDSPGFRIKPRPEIGIEDKYLKLNTEVYGGPILNTWFDRPLSIGGRLYLKSNKPLKPREVLFDFEEPIAIIPNLAIHMNREVNKGIEINPQTDSLPILATINKDFEKENYLLKRIAERAGLEIGDILDFDLFLYPKERGQIVGLDREFISAPKLDNLGMVHASLYAFTRARMARSTNVLVCFDNEEVGSRTKQGAASPMLRTVLERISLSIGANREDYYRALSKSFLISADQAHALHPNYAHKQDPTSRPVINGGPVIKIAASQSYTTDSFSSSVYEGICRSKGIPLQKFVNRSDERGGSTIGPISSIQLDIPAIDMGNPILGMHSIRELGGVLDHYLAYESFKEFYGIS